MAERRFYPLHLPFKNFSSLRSNVLRNAIRRHVPLGADTVTDDQVAAVIDEVLKVQGEDHRNDWLELERWVDRLRDEIGGGGGGIGPVGVPPQYRATYVCNSPADDRVSTWHSGSPWTVEGFHTTYNENTAVFNSTNNPAVLLPGPYFIRCDYTYTIPGSKFAQCNVGLDPFDAGRQGNLRWSRCDYQVSYDLPYGTGGLTTLTGRESVMGFAEAGFYFFGIVDLHGIVNNTPDAVGSYTINIVRLASAW